MGDVTAKQNSNNINKEKFKITPLQDRRSETRRIRANTLTRYEIESPVKVNIQPVQIGKPNAVQESMQINEHEQIVTYSLFTKLVGKCLFLFCIFLRQSYAGSFAFYKMVIT
jgi:hypothetical protein